MVRAYESFAFKIIQNQKITLYFNKEILIKLMAEKLCNGAYQAIEEKKYRKSSLVAINSKLKAYIPQWTVNQKFKFFIKLLRLYL